MAGGPARLSCLYDNGYRGASVQKWTPRFYLMSPGLPDVNCGNIFVRIEQAAFSAPAHWVFNIAMLRPIALKVFEIPAVYNTYQWAVGAPNCQRYFMEECVAAQPGQRILDIGCGVGAGLRYLPAGIDYIGVDISEPYIARAKEDFGDRGAFLCTDITKESPEKFGLFDGAYAFGVLHHLSDEGIAGVAAFLKRALKPGGRFTTIDPCFRGGQGWMARYLIGQDRGEFVRDRQCYENMFAHHGEVRSSYVENVLRIPYTQLVMTFTPNAH